LRSPPTNPASTSPAPAVARVGGALAFIAALPSGAAITVSAPFRMTTAPVAVLASLARSSFEPDAAIGKARWNSPSCGVTTVGAARPARDLYNLSEEPAKALSPPASSTTAAGDA